MDKWIKFFLTVHGQTQKRVGIHVARIKITLHLHNISGWMDKHQALDLWLLHGIFVDQPHEVVPCLTLKQHLLLTAGKATHQEQLLFRLEQRPPSALLKFPQQAFAPLFDPPTFKPHFLHLHQNGNTGTPDTNTAPEINKVSFFFLNLSWLLWSKCLAGTLTLFLSILPQEKTQTKTLSGGDRVGLFHSEGHHRCTAQHTVYI